MAEDGYTRTPEEEAELLERLQEQIRQLSVADHLVYMLESLAALATRKMGLTADTADERDPDQARLAIDAFAALLKVVEPARPQQEVASHRGMLSQLQLAFVRCLEAPRPAEAGDAEETGGPVEEEGGAAEDEGPARDDAAEEPGGAAEEEAPAEEAEADRQGDHDAEAGGQGDDGEAGARGDEDVEADSRDDSA